MTSKLVVTKDNQLIQNAGYELSVSEQRVILLCIGKLDSRNAMPDAYSFTISVQDFENELGLDKDNAYRDLKSAVNKLYKRSINLDTDDPDSEMRWIWKKTFIKSKSELTIFFSPTILPFLTALKERFTSYLLKDVAKFSSAHSFRFYELFASWIYCKNELTVDIDWIKNALQLEDKYSDTFELKRRVIIPAIRDINLFSNIHVTFEHKKNGKTITHFIFKFQLKEPQQPSINKTRTRTQSSDYTPEQKAAVLADLQAQLEKKRLKQKVEGTEK